MTEIRTKRRNAGQTLVTERDERALAWLSQMRVIFEVDVALFLRQQGFGALAPGGVTSLVNRWARAGWVEAGRVYVARPRMVTLTVAGASVVGVPSYRKLAEGFRVHHSEVARVRLWLSGLGSFGSWGALSGWESERLLRSASYVPDGGMDRTPDGLAHFERQTDVAVEVELSVKAPAELDAKVEAAALGWPSVAFFCGSREVNGAVTRSVTRLTDAGRIPTGRVWVLMVPTDPTVVV